MPNLELPLEKGGPVRVTLSWIGKAPRDVRVLFDGAELGVISDGDELRRGRSFVLPDGSDLLVKLVVGFPLLSSDELWVLRSGKPLPGSASDPERRLWRAVLTIFVVAICSIAIGITALVTDSEQLRLAGFGPGWAIFGAVYALLGWIVHSRHSYVALCLAVSAPVLDGVAYLYLSLQMDFQPSLWLFVVRVAVVLMMWRGFGAIRELNAEGGDVECGVEPEG